MMTTYTREQLLNMTGEDLLKVVAVLNTAYSDLKTRAAKLEKWKPGVGITCVYNAAHDDEKKHTSLTIQYEGQKECTCYIKDGEADGVGITGVEGSSSPLPGRADGKYRIKFGKDKFSEITTKRGPKGKKGKSLDGTEYYQSGWNKGWVKQRKTVAGADMSANAVKGSITGASFGGTAMSASLSIVNIGFAGATNALTGVYNTFDVAENNNAGAANGVGKGEPDKGPPPGQAAGT